MSTARERQAERRQERLREVQRQIARGTLVVRQMTAAERAAHPPQNRTRKRH